jgi:hypothetical protein
METKNTGNLETKKPDKKRTKYARHECPYCHKVKGNLANHIKAVHPVEAKERKEETTTFTKEVLTGEKTPEEVKALAPVHPEDITYYCEDCHAEVRKGEEKCWNCGKELDWTSI